MAPPLPLQIRSPLLDDEAGKFLEQATRLRDVVKEGEPALTALGRDGLGRDDTGRAFTEAFWKQQAKVLEALGNAIAVVMKIYSGLYGVARALPGADEATAQVFTSLTSPADDIPATPYLETPRYIRRSER
jgi:hypothetical protein